MDDINFYSQQITSRTEHNTQRSLSPEDVSRKAKEKEHNLDRKGAKNAEENHGRHEGTENVKNIEEHVAIQGSDEKKGKKADHIIRSCRLYAR
ncbi:hypothetical protein KIN20_006333 [Parelaphostrongylus tenuis]|uniref:Uncharacterized protein n=1 Tax=Parelaphostrongylus tenuis TaxID=148309 RepID=A0AAD5M4L6_PARTN|nr:hypothetical protein KIN20_006333 [Parelaphostrongylus tenuis]